MANKSSEPLGLDADSSTSAEEGIVLTTRRSSADVPTEILVPNSQTHTNTPGAISENGKEGNERGKPHASHLSATGSRGRGLPGFIEEDEVRGHGSKGGRSSSVANPTRKGQVISEARKSIHISTLPRLSKESMDRASCESFRPSAVSITVMRADRTTQVYSTWDAFQAQTQVELERSRSEKTFFWLDFTGADEIIAKKLEGMFGLHPLTCEDILALDTREKVELYEDYLFSSFRALSDPSSHAPSADVWSSYDGMNVSVCVFGTYVLTFHPDYCRAMEDAISDMQKPVSHLQPDWALFLVLDRVMAVVPNMAMALEDEADAIDELMNDLGPEDRFDTLQRIDLAAKHLSKLSQRVRSKRDMLLVLTGSASFYQVSVNHSVAGGQRPETLSGRGGDGLHAEENMSGIGGGSLAGSGLEKESARVRAMGMTTAARNAPSRIPHVAKETFLYFRDLLDDAREAVTKLDSCRGVLNDVQAANLADIRVGLLHTSEESTGSLGKLLLAQALFLPMMCLTASFSWNILIPFQGGEDGMENLYAWFGILFACFLLGVAIFTWAYKEKLI